MDIFVAAIPLFNAKMEVQAYRISTHDRQSLFGLRDGHYAQGDMLPTPALDLVEGIGIEPFASDKPLFADVNHLQIMMGVPMNKRIDPARLVCVLPKDVPSDAAVMERLLALKEKGYRLGLTRPSGIPQEDPLADIADYYVIDHNRAGGAAIHAVVRRMRRDQHMLIDNVSDVAAYQRYGNLFNTIYSGRFYSQPVTQGRTAISALKVNTLNLMRQVADEDVDLAGIARTIERDPALSISLLRFINSPSVNVRRRIDSIRSGVAILGQRELQRWMTVTLSVSLAEDRPSELTKLSLVRAKFAENLATAFEMGALAQSLFMAGLFSLVDVILQKPMQEAIEEISVDDQVREALVNRRGRLYEALDFIYAYERGDWDGVTINVIRNRVDADKAADAYIDALQWYKQLLEEIDESGEGEAVGAEAP